MLIVGLTGGIGSGKSAASKLFEELSAHVVDADLVAREVVAPGMPALSFIKDQFGEKIINTDGTLNRALLRDIIFTDSNAKRWLETLLHPVIRSEIIRQLSEASSPYAILVSPLLFETKQHQLCSRTLLIDAPEELQRSRAAKRDDTNEDAIQKIIEAQMPRDAKIIKADDIICNDQDEKALGAMVDSQHRKYLSIAQKKTP